jgi:multidrug efflux pump subunit AcrA (membrane-fusion protein)
VNLSLRRRVCSGLLLALVVLAGCTSHKPAAEEAMLVVSVAQLKEGKALTYEDFTGRTAAIPSVDIQARASGYLDKVLFVDGQEVKEGQLLYVIDPRPYEADVQFAKGNLASTQAKLEKANNDLARARRMTLSSAIGRQEYDQYIADKMQADAQLISNRANLKTAELNLSFCKVTAPFNGRISRTKIDAGNLVTANVTQLTSIVSLDPIFAYFDADEHTVLRVQRMMREEISDTGVARASDYLRERKLDAATVKQALALIRSGLSQTNHDRLRKLVEGKLGSDGWSGLRAVLEANPLIRSAREAKVPVYLRAVRGEKGHSHLGYIDFVDNRFDQTTGTHRLRGQFPNKQRILTPNMSVSIRVPLGEPRMAILVSDAILGTDLDRKFLFVLNDKDEVEQRPVVLGPESNGMRVIESGVKAGEWVVVSNLQRVRPGMTVKRKEAPMPTPPEQEDLAPPPPPAIRKK